MARSRGPSTWYAAGLNAHSQIINNNGYDVFTFTPLGLPRERSFDHDEPGATVFFASWSTTILRTSEALLTLGHQASLHHPGLSPQEVQRLHSAFGDHNSFNGCLSEEGHLYAVDARTESLVLQSDQPSPKISHIAIAGNGTVALTILQDQEDHNCNVFQFGSLDAVFKWFHSPSESALSETFIIRGRPAQLVAGIGHYSLLMGDGQVYSWGDPRYRSLGRETSVLEPANKPHVVEALGGLKIVKIATGGWMGAALSEDGAAYVWGSAMPGSGHGTLKALQDAEAGEVSLVEIDDIDDPLDVLDIGVGDGHIVVLARGGRIFVCGENGNGQLGLGKAAPEFVEEWTEVGDDAHCFESVVCGPRVSFLLMRDMDARSPNQSS